MPVKIHSDKMSSILSLILSTASKSFLLMVLLEMNLYPAGKIHFNVAKQIHVLSRSLRAGNFHHSQPKHSALMASGAALAQGMRYAILLCWYL